MNKEDRTTPDLLQHRIQGALVAGAIGDALGWITEFERSPEDLQRKYGVAQVTDFVAWSKRVGGRFHGYTDEIRPGEYSDDTQLMLCTARCVSDQGHFDVARFTEIEFPAWLDYARGAGSTVKNAAKAIQRKKATWYNNLFRYTVRGRRMDYRDAGANGAAMRIAPIALVHCGWSGQVARDIWSNTIVSHGHPRAIWGALIHGYALSTLLTATETFETSAFIEDVATFVKSLAIPEDEHIHAWQNAWDAKRGSRKTFREAFEDTREEAIEQLRMVYRAVRDSIPITSVLTQLGCFSPTTRSSGLGTVLAGMFFFAHTPDKVEQVIVNAVDAIGTDTDSIATFAGNLAGCLNRIGAVPQRWRDGLQDNPYLMRLGERLAAIAHRTSPTPFDSRQYLDEEGVEGHIPQFRQGEYVHHRALGYGRIETVDRQTTPSGREVLLVRATFDQGQSAKFAIRDTNRSPLLVPMQGRLL
jgi:ADP-ribosylglycohydrolase